LKNKNYTYPDTTTDKNINMALESYASVCSRLERGSLMNRRSVCFVSRIWYCLL